MSHKRILVLGGAGLLGLLTAILGASITISGTPLEVLTAASNALRALSLSGVIGNLAAWAIVYLLAAPPLLWMLLQWRKREKHWSDLLAPLASLLIGMGMYALANPTRLAAPIIELARFWPLAYWTAALSALVCWAILISLQHLERSGALHLGSALSVLLLVAAALMVFAAVNAGVSQYLSLMAQTAEENMSMSPLLAAYDLGVNPAQMTSNTRWLLLALTILDVIPTLLGAVVLLWSMDLVQAVQTAPFTEEAVTLSEKMAAGCCRMVRANVLISVGSNLLQLAAFPHVAHTNFTVNLPLLPLLLSAALFLLCRLFQHGQQLQQDNDSII